MKAQIATSLESDVLCKKIPAYFSFTVNVQMLKFSEEELIAGLLQRNHHVFSYLYDNYAAALKGAIYRMVACNESSEDILQEVFIKIWNGISSYDKTKGRLYTWMLKLAINHSIDFTRSKVYKGQKKVSAYEPAHLNHCDNNYKTDYFDGIGLKNKISRLNPENAAIIKMAYFDGYTQNEIAKILNMPLGTVKTKIRTALIELRKMSACIQKQST